MVPLTTSSLLGVNVPELSLLSIISSIGSPVGSPVTDTKGMVVTAASATPAAPI